MSQEREQDTTGRSQHGSRACRMRCPYFRMDLGEARRRGVAWPVFCTAAGDEPAAWQALDREFMEGPASNCPAGRWSGPDTKSPAEVKERARLARLERQVCAFAPKLGDVWKGEDEAFVVSKLERMVEDGILEPEAAVQIAEAILEP